VKHLASVDIAKDSIHSGQVSLGFVIDQLLAQNQAVLSQVEISILDMESLKNVQDQPIPAYRVNMRYSRAEDIIIKAGELG
jgi:hypothetical protein